MAEWLPRRKTKINGRTIELAYVCDLQQKVPGKELQKKAAKRNLLCKSGRITTGMTLV